MYVDVYVHDFVGAIEKGIRNGLAHADAGRAADRVIERLEMLDVHGGHHADAGLEQFQDVLIALGVPAARRVGMGELIHHAQLRIPGEDGVEIHFLERNASIVKSFSREDLEIGELGFCLGAAVRLDEPDDRIDPFTARRVRVLNHRKGLADARRRADVNAQPRPVFYLQPCQQLIAVRAVLDAHTGIVAEPIRGGCTPLRTLYDFLIDCLCQGRLACKRGRSREAPMIDVVFVLITGLFFLLAIGYVTFCARLMD